MKRRKPVLAWKATFVFYLVLLATITFVSWINGVSTASYWLLQVGLVTLGVGLMVLIGNRYQNFSAEGSVLLAFGIGVFTIIPGVLMSLNPPSPFWMQYFPIGMAMAAGSFLTFGFMEVIKKLSQSKKNDLPPYEYKKGDSSSSITSVDSKAQSKLIQLQDQVLHQKTNPQNGQDNDNNDT